MAGMVPRQLRLVAAVALAMMVWGAPGAAGAGKSMMQDLHIPSLVSREPPKPAPVAVGV